jgi:hypothetical protein
MPYRIIPPKKWPARDEVRRLAREHTVEAMRVIIKLMQESESDFVRGTAARTVVTQSGILAPRRNPRPSRPEKRRRGATVNVKITRFNEDKQDEK